MSYCYNCGARIEAYYRFCPICGTELLNTEESFSEENSPEEIEDVYEDEYPPEEEREDFVIVTCPEYKGRGVIVQRDDFEFIKGTRTIQCPTCGGSRVIKKRI